MESTRAFAILPFVYCQANSAGQSLGFPRLAETNERYSWVIPSFSVSGEGDGSVVSSTMGSKPVPWLPAGLSWLSDLPGGRQSASISAGVSGCGIPSIM